MWINNLAGVNQRLNARGFHEELQNFFVLCHR